MTFETVLRDQFVRYPSMQIQDVYKLVYQAVMGAEHAVADPERARNWMARELAEMGEGPSEPVIDPISEDGQIVRVHLRPFVGQGRDVETLLEAFIRTANEFHGQVQALKNNWKIVAGMGFYSIVEMDGFIQSIQDQDYPALHHSPEYKLLYHPAYRVVWRKYIS